MPLAPSAPASTAYRLPNGQVPALAVLRHPRLLSTEVLAGMVTTLALIPEVISFSLISGVGPDVALISSVTLAIAMSFLGGRPAMVSAAAGSVALVIAPMVAAHGTGYVLPTVLLTGVLQVLFGVFGLARLVRYIPRSVMIGFVNALGVLIFVAQVSHVIDVPWMVYPLFIATILIVVLLPRITTAVPAPLVAIVVVTAAAMVFGLGVPTVGDEGSVSGGLPGLTPWTVPFDLTTLQIILPTAVGAALVGLLESLLTAKLVDDLTDSRSSKSRESWGLGVANILAGLWGGVAGCAMIGQTVVNVQLGRARSRVSTVIAGLFLLLLVAVLSPVMAAIPMAALAAVMMVVALRTIDWHSIRPATLKRMPLSETVVMLVTVAVVVATGNLAIGVGAGVLLALVLFARRIAHVTSVEREIVEGGAVAHYRVLGPLFFASSNDLVDRFSYVDDPARIVIDLSGSHVWDASSVAVLDAVETKYAAHGATVELVGLNPHSRAFHGRLSGSLDGSA
ncbi:SulP family inorganic anion transporter [Microbacterium sp. KUDC0406]|uniref:SulP family inorganic anion transporter n=1 Tax=Microbacterium sp. KUDC0406 TaxID=2909588 RepID=UPI001F1C546F|nr:SulP family inorganic anion transporter [Microbacterium sp. KUDC0406]UJP10860.1 SulP family inorganic anion transporter [Microbacterium sp. KUDC0406]